jgi:hypothetical protein
MPIKTAAQIKAEMLKKKAAAKLEASKNKKPSSIKNKGEVKETKPTTSKPKPKPKFKYKTIEAKSKYNPKFQKETIDDKDLKLQEESPAKMTGRSYDMKMAYDKKLTPKARLHYLENERHDAPGKMKGSPYHMSNELKYGGPVIDQMQTLSQISASKVLRHMKK